METRILGFAEQLETTLWGLTGGRSVYGVAKDAAVIKETVPWSAHSPPVRRQAD